MHFTFSDFIKNIPEGIPKQELAVKIYEEIRAAENMKVGYLDQANENPEFYVNISRELDNYISNLKLFHNKLAPQPIALDQEVFKAEQADLEQIMQLVKRIEDAERNRLGDS